MALDINNITPASEKAKEIATESYVDNGIAAIPTLDVNSMIDTSNDAFAQRLGYMDYSDMIAAASDGKTVINGGYINAGLLQAQSITADQINTQGLIADNISSNLIVGKTIEGGVINGARINGAVIKASYLDLDGEIEVLTDYHLATSQTQLNDIVASGGVGTLYTNSTEMPDAVYLSADNSYRIPTLSQVRESTLNYSLSAGQSKEGNIFSFDTYNNASAQKVRRINPFVSVVQESKVLSGTFSVSSGRHKGFFKYRLYIGDEYCEVYWDLQGQDSDGTIVNSNGPNDSGQWSTSVRPGKVYVNGVHRFTPKSGRTNWAGLNSDYNGSHTQVVNGVSLLVRVFNSLSTCSFSISIVQNNYDIASLEGQKALLKGNYYQDGSSTTNSTCVFHTTNSISVNNMI